jgi:hypothetical protein
MPIVKEGDGLFSGADFEGALAKYRTAMSGFRDAGFKRPKLKEKLDAATAAIEAASEPEPEA